MKKLLLLFTVLTGLLQAQCNLNFESGTFAGWKISDGSPSLSTNSAMTGCCTTTASAEAFVLSTPFSDPYLVTIPHSPLGGTKIARLNLATGNFLVTRITNSFVVTPSNSTFQYAISVVVDGISEACSSVAYSNVTLKDNGGAVILGTHYVPTGSLTAGCSSPAFTNTVLNTAFFCWKTYSVNLTPYLGQTVSIEITSGDCGGGGHFSYCYFDAACSATTPTAAVCGITSGMTEIVEIAVVQVWPNPAKDFINVQINNSSNCEIIIYDLLGKVVIHKKELQAENAISIKNLNQGLYFYTIVQNNKPVKTGKIIKE